MSEISWKQIVAEQALRIVNARKTPEISIKDIYEAESVIQERFPRNRNIREKIRQTLQRLRDDGFLVFLGGGDYQINFAWGELAWEPVALGESGIEIPETRTVVRTIRLRNTFLAADIKRKYDNVCQVCCKQIQLSNCTYAESHHVKPIGSPHFGPDVQGVQLHWSRGIVAIFR